MMDFYVHYIAEFSLRSGVLATMEDLVANRLDGNSGPRIVRSHCCGMGSFQRLESTIIRSMTASIVAQTLTARAHASSVSWCPPRRILDVWEGSLLPREHHEWDG